MEKQLKTRELVRGGLLVAIILLMAFTPLGYLKTPGIEITFIMIPVVIGAVTMGPLWGAALGFMFGLTSFMQSFQTPFGTALLGISLPATAATCFIPRILMGYLTGLLYWLLSKKAGKKLWPTAVAGLAGPLLNTILFMSSLMLFFGQTEVILALRAGTPLIPFLVAFVGLNGLVEAAACFVVSTAICRALMWERKAAR